MPYPISGDTKPDPMLTPLGNATVSAIKDLLTEGESANTRASYQSALRYWQAWHRLRYGEEMAWPTDVVHVLQFIVDHAERLTPTGLRCAVPAKITSCIDPPRRDFALCSPSTHRIASDTLLLPDPFGPTTPVIPL